MLLYSLFSVHLILSFKGSAGQYLQQKNKIKQQQQKNGGYFLQDQTAS